jgi:hypothetical protein
LAECSASIIAKLPDDGIFRHYATFENAKFVIGAACREHDGAGGSIIGTIKLNRQKLRQCKKSFGASLSEFLAASAASINSYAAANGYRWTVAPDNPYGVFGQMVQTQQQIQQSRPHAQVDGAVPRAMSGTGTSSTNDLQHAREQIARESERAIQYGSSGNPLPSATESSGRGLGAERPAGGGSSTRNGTDVSVPSGAGLTGIPYPGAGCAPDVSYVQSHLRGKLWHTPQVSQTFTQSIDASIKSPKDLDRQLVAMKIQLDEYRRSYEQAKTTVEQITDPSGRGTYDWVEPEDAQGARDLALAQMHTVREAWIVSDAMIRAYECRRQRGY